MFFTQDDYRKIEEWLRTRTVKDSEFPHADPLRGNEDVPIIQDGKNKTLTIDELVKQVAMMELPDFFNVTTFAKKGNLFLEDAINCIPVEQRKLGLTITFHSAKGHWLIYQFKGTSLNQWSSLNYWRSPIEEALEELVLYPDEEDITGVRDGNRTFLKFKDKNYDPADFSGMGRIMLRKNLVGTEACSLDDEDHMLNILTQDMIREENTVYIVQYDFDLDGKVISIPKGCTLWFQGGSINNGTIYLQETAILGAFEFADMGNAKLFGKFNTGQIMTFSNDSYKSKEGGYFIPSTKPSSATTEEDPKQDREVFYDENSEAYNTEQRQELRWWNGEEWILILDITDYNEIKSIINDLIEKHNAEMSACYKYFKARLYALELRMDDAERRLDEHDTIIENHETRITNIEGDIENIHNDITNINNNITDILNQINNLSDIINNIENIITEEIKKYIENNVIGVASVTVNGQTYTPDSSGNITLPDYPESGGGIADQTKGTLNFTGAVTASYNGSSDVTVNIPEGGSSSGGITGTLRFTGASTAEYNGTEDVTVNIPEGSGEADSVKGTLTIRASNGNTLVTYNGSTDETLTLPESGSGNTIITAKEPLTITQGDATLGIYDGTTAKTIDIPNSVDVANKVSKKLKFTGAVTAEYDGSSEVTVNIPSGGGEGGSTFDPKTLFIKDYTDHAVVEYNATVEKTLKMDRLKITSPSVYSYYNPLQSSELGEQTIDLSPIENGALYHPVVLLNAEFINNGYGAWVMGTSNLHSGITGVAITPPSAGRALLTLTMNSSDTLDLTTAVVSVGGTKKSSYDSPNEGNYTDAGAFIQCSAVGNTIYLRGWRLAKDDGNNVVLKDDALELKEGANVITRFSLVVIGIRRTSN